MTEPPINSPTFLALLSAHASMMTLLEEHQAALLDRDFGRALERLLELRREFEHHVRGEEELFTRLFAQVDQVRGTPLDLFTGEHKHLREMLGEFETSLRRFDATATGRNVIELIEDELVFKSFFRHHDEREKNLLYPAFDTGTSEAKRAELLRRFHTG